MRSAFTRASIALVSVSTIAAVAAGASAQAAPPFTPDAVAEALTFSAVPDVTGTVPSGACSASFIVRGGSGAGASLASASAPGQVSGTLEVTAGQSYRLSAGTSANGLLGGIGGNGNGGNGYTNVSDSQSVGYGGGAGSGFQLGNSLAAVAGGGGGAANDWMANAPGGAGGGGVGGAGGDGSTGANGYYVASRVFGGPVIMTGMANGSPAQANPNTTLYGGAGGGGGYSGGQGSTIGLSAGGGSNYANTSLPGMTVAGNGAYSAAASGYSGIAFSACPNPSSVASVTVAPNGTSAVLSFPAAIDNGTPVTGYQYTLNNGSSWNTLTTSGSSTKTATLSSLSLSTSSTLQVRPVYLTADIEANAVANGGPGRAVTSYVSATSQSFTTLAQDVVAPTSLAETGSNMSSTPLAGALAALVAGVSFVISRRRQQNT